VPPFQAALGPDLGLGSQTAEAEGEVAIDFSAGTQFAVTSDSTLFGPKLCLDNGGHFKKLPFFESAIEKAEGCIGSKFAGLLD